MYAWHWDWPDAKEGRININKEAGKLHSQLYCLHIHKWYVQNHTYGTMKGYSSTLLCPLDIQLYT